MSKLVGLCGKARSGKSTVAEFLQDHFRVRTFEFMGPLKQAAAILLKIPEDDVRGLSGYDREKPALGWDFSVREFLQKTGTEGFLHLFGQSFWTNRMALELLDDEGSRAPCNTGRVITDIRYDHEAEFVRRRGGKVWHIERQGYDGLQGTTADHATEQQVSFSPGDVHFLNNGTLEELEDKVRVAWIQS